MWLMDHGMDPDEVDYAFEGNQELKNMGELSDRLGEFLMDLENGRAEDDVYKHYGDHVVGYIVDELLPWLTVEQIDAEYYRVLIAGGKLRKRHLKAIHAKLIALDDELVDRLEDEIRDRKFSESYYYN